jgi:EAL domain-containing protein (putative c-di-GMP-specific phosphodiesterase class I)
MLSEPTFTDSERVRVLVVDDDDAVRRALTRVLRASGYEVVVAHDGMEAVGTLGSNPPFDLILSDIQMPGTSGIELLRIVRARDLDVPVVLMTGYPTVDTAIEAVGLGTVQYLVKPVDQKQLLTVAQEAFKMHRLAKARRAIDRALGRTGQAGDLAGLDVSLERALGSLWMAFQPIVDVRSRTLLGYEALMRTEDVSLPNPGAILGAAERLDRVWDVGRQVRSSCAEAGAQVPNDLLLFVNLHSLDLLDPTLYDPEGPLASLAKRVVLEITERSSFDGVRDIQARVARLRSLGFRIALDDLGAGYASLSRFVALKPELVKLDMSLVRGIHESTVQQQVVRSMTTLCTEIGLCVIAEGVELPEERDCLLALGCHYLQGYLFAKPGPAFPAVQRLAYDAALQAKCAVQI